MEQNESKPEKKHFFLKLIPPRATFIQDMTSEERSIMMQHVEYWKDLTAKGFAIVYGPVFDPNGGYGVGIVEVENDEQMHELTSKDPAAGLNKYEVYPMKAVLPRR